MGFAYDAEKMNELRKELEDLINTDMDLTDPRVINLSRQLDDLINQCQSNYYGSFSCSKSKCEKM